MTDKTSATQAVRLVMEYPGYLKPQERDTLGAIAKFYPDARPSLPTLAASLDITPDGLRKRLWRLTERGLLNTTYTGRYETRRAHRHILLPGFPEAYTTTRDYSKVDLRRCANPRCRKPLEGRRAGATYCNDACRKAAARSSNKTVSRTAQPVTGR